jgi:hypothetical protein
MSEIQHHAPKHEKLPSHEGNSEALKEHLDALKRKAEADSETQADDEALEALKQDIDKQALSKEDYRHSEAGHSAEITPAHTYVSRELKQMGFRRTLTNARLHMGKPAQLFSKAIHQPVVEKISEAAAPTVARPSGILGGGIAALLGSVILLYVSKHNGYQYNYFVFFVLFVGGFVAGMAVELLIRAFIRRKS